MGGERDLVPQRGDVGDVGDGKSDADEKTWHNGHDFFSLRDFLQMARCGINGRLGRGSRHQRQGLRHW